MDARWPLPILAALVALSGQVRASQHLNVHLLFRLHVDDHGPSSLAFNRAGDQLAVAIDRGITVVSPTSGAFLGTASLLGPTYLSFLGGANRVAAGTVSGHVALVDTDRRKVVGMLPVQYSFVDGIAASPDGATLAVSGTQDFGLWTVDGGRLKRAMVKGDWCGGRVAYSPDGTRVATGYYELKEWRLGPPDRPLVRNTVDGTVLGLAYSPGGACLAVAHASGQVEGWEARGKTRLFITKPNRAWAYCVAFHPEGKMFAVGFRTNVKRDLPASLNTIRIYDLKGRFLKKLRMHCWGVNDLAFSPDGTKLACVDNNGFLWIWRVQKAGRR